MISKFITLPLFIAAGVVAHPTIMRRADIPSLSQWASSGLESFWTFRVRYESLDCASQTGTDFYTTCCYPLPASQDPSTLPSECTPATLSCSSNGPWNSTVTVTPAAASPTPSDTPVPTPDNTPQPSPTDDGNDNSDQSYNNTDSSSDNGNTDNSGSDSTESWNGGNNGSSGSNNTNNSGNTNNGSSGGSNSGSNSGSSGNVNTGGFATYYYQNGNPGACGNYNSDSALIGAIDIAWYGNTGAVSQYCGKSVQITNLNNGKTVDIIVADVCPTCDTSNSFDLSVGAFSAIADLSDGEVPITWFFN